MKPHILLLIPAALMCAPIGSTAVAGGRKALVIGNSGYPSGPLRNPANDAAAMSRTLKDLGFDVVSATDAGLRQMEEQVSSFGQHLAGADVALFYYAGHAVQMNGHNYLIPVDATIERDTDVKYEALDVGRVLDELDGAGTAVNIVILDACRDNPFARSFRSATRGLAQMDAPKGAIVAYSTAPGATATDGDGVNSPYTAALTRHMLAADLDVEQVFKRTRRDVDAATGGKQTPWESTSLIGDFYFARGRGMAVQPVPTPAPVTPTPPPARPEPLSTPRTTTLGVVESVNKDWGYVVITLNAADAAREGDEVFIDQNGAQRKATIKRVWGTRASAMEATGFLQFTPGSPVTPAR